MSYEQLLEVWDHLPPAHAIARAWQDPGPAHGTWHKRAREDVHYLMPLLARALDRLLEDLAGDIPDRRLWEWPEGHDPAAAVRLDRLRAKVRGRR